MKKGPKIDAQFVLPESFALLAEWMSAPPAVEDDRLPTAQLTGVTDEPCLLMGLSGHFRLIVEGAVGHYAVAFNAGPEIRIYGVAGDGVGEGMESGSVRVHGDAGRGVGTAMTGGTLAIYGSVGADAACALRGGSVFIRGSAGPGAASSAIHGTLVIGGKAGAGVGDQMQDTVIFIRGAVESLGRGVVETPVTQGERLRLGLLLLDAGIRGEAADFRRYVSARAAEREAAARRKVGAMK